MVRLLQDIVFRRPGVKAGRVSTRGSEATKPFPEGKVWIGVSKSDSERIPRRIRAGGLARGLRSKAWPSRGPWIRRFLRTCKNLRFPRTSHGRHPFSPRTDGEMHPAADRLLSRSSLPSSMSLRMSSPKRVLAQAKLKAVRLSRGFVASEKRCLTRSKKERSTRRLTSL